MTERAALREERRIKPADLEAVSDVLSSPDNRLVGGLLDLVEKYGGVDAINRQADEAGQLETRIARLQDEGSPFLPGIEWLAEQRDARAFVTLPEYRRSVLGSAGGAMTFDEARAVTLKISALRYFPWLIDQARQAIERGELMPGRYIRVRNIAGQSAPHEDILAVAAAMQISGATHVETLDTHASTAPMSTWVAPTPSRATSAASVSPTTTRSSGQTSTSASLLSLAYARSSTSTAAPSLWVS